MKAKRLRLSLFISTLLVPGSLLWPAVTRAQSADTKVRITSPSDISDKKSDSERDVVVKIATAGDEAAQPMKDRAWLGVSVEETSEALTAQLGLDPGVGLVVTQVSPDGPAAKAGLQKNDVLVELANQSLVHPAQLRKLVQARKAGDKVELVFYRSGKRQTSTATLEKAPARFGLFDESFGDGRLRELHRKLLELPHGEALRESLRQIPDEVGHGIEIEVKRGMEQAHKAIAEAAREVDRNKDSLRKERTRLKELFTSGISVDDNATVVVRSNGKSTRSIVKTDDWGMLVIVGPPSLHLTARDKSGEMLFEGDIETPEQRAKVPAEVWKRAEPLLDEK